MQSFTVNNLNQLSNATRSGNLTVAGATHGPATSVTVADNGNSPVTAVRYADATFARTNVTLVNGNNTFVAVGTDSLGRGDTNTVTVNLPATVTFLYDLNGNLRTNGTKILKYDDENQLTRMTEPNSWKAEFVYDGKMRLRISKDYEWRNGGWVQTNEVRRVYDGNLVLQERDQFNLPKVTYTRGRDLGGSLQGAGGIGGLLAFSKLNGSAAQHYCYHADGNGNITALISGQIIVGRYLYDPFGNTLAVQGSLAQENLYRFSSKEWHGPSGMVSYGYRWYIPELQRWGNRDPLSLFAPQSRFASVVDKSDQRNLFHFTLNSPINNFDALGLETEAACLAACRLQAILCHTLVAGFEAACLAGATAICAGNPFCIFLLGKNCVILGIAMHIDCDDAYGKCKDGCKEKCKPKPSPSPPPPGTFDV